MSTSTAEPSGLDNVRHRARAASSISTDTAPEAVTEKDREARPNKTYGRTPDGTGMQISNSAKLDGRGWGGMLTEPCLPATPVFVVPETHDMVSQLLDPREPKNLSDVLVLAILALHIWAAYALPSSLKRPVFALIFLFWRASYNVGIGYLLTVQSNYKLIVTWAKRMQLFEKPSTGKNPRPWLYQLLQNELEAKIPKDYKMAEAPLEYNTWLVFRRVVDLILMCDFVSYCLFAIVCSHKPVSEGFAIAAARWVIGVALVGFNLWVKLDAHRVVKDYAWYWGGK